MRNLRHELYGESVFTSFRTLNSKVLGLEFHIERLLSGVKDIFNFCDMSEKEFLTYFINDLNLDLKFKEYPNHYFRITFYSEGSTELNRHSFSLGEMKVDLSIKPMEELPKKSLKLKTFPTPFSEFYTPYKTGSYQPFLFFRKKALKVGYDDVLFLAGSNVLEASTSNIIFIKEEKVFTPDDPRVLNGVTVQCLESYIEKTNYSFEKEVVNLRDLKKFDASFCLNSVKGITPVTRIDDYIFPSYNKYEKLFNKFYESMK